MSESYELTSLDANSFEHMVNFLALKVLGNGVTGFSAGADGGRDGYLEGEAPYPTARRGWKGTWYIQSKFHKPHLSKNPQAWLITQVDAEIKLFLESNSRTLPDVWIIATNIEPTGVAKTGAFDVIAKKVKSQFGKSVKFDIWGGRKILDFLADDPAVARHYGHFLTPGNVLSSLYDQINDSSAQVDAIVEYFVINQFSEQIYTKLEQAGSSSDTRPKIYELFIDLPFSSPQTMEVQNILRVLVSASSNVHKASTWVAFGDGWQNWSKIPKRSRVLLLKGGPGQGKSTAGQYFSQIQRAAIILNGLNKKVLPSVLDTAASLKKAAQESGFWSEVPRIPISIELKDFASWYGLKGDSDSKGVVSYLSEKISQKIDQEVKPGTLKRALSAKSWFVNFDGLDEVPNDVKDKVASEIIRFTNVVLPSLDSDAYTLCTTRPQGYSGQFRDLDAAVAELCALPRDIALACASAVVRFGRTVSETETAIQTLSSAMQSEQVRELMTTPLQSHIMAVVVRDGGRPPEKRWQLFDNFYQVMKKRESQKNFPDPRISKMLRENETLLKAIHCRLGVSLHARAESSEGAETTLDKAEFESLARQTTEILIEENVNEVVETLMEATIERLVFVNTPESSNSVRFDIRQLQEFFAGEFIYSDVEPHELRSRMELICADSHWREVMHFLLSALIVNGRTTDILVALDVLSKIDEDEDCRYTKIFNRRMGVGALLSLRLLSEGVLEQDRRMRHKFMKVLTPLYGMLDPEILDDITSITQPNSLAWLIGCMIDAVVDLNEAEQIGAALILVKKLPDNHSRLVEVRSKLFDSTAAYLECVYNYYRDQRYDHRHTSVVRDIDNDWFIVASLNFIAYKVLDDFDYSTVIDFLRVHRDKVLRLMVLSDLDSFAVSILLALIDDKIIERKSKKVSVYAGLSFTAYKHSWMTKTVPSILDINVDIDVEGNGYSKLFQLVRLVVIFARDQSYENFVSFVLLFRRFKKWKAVFPAYIEALLPLNFWFDSSDTIFDYYLNLGSEGFDSVMRQGEYAGFRLLPMSSIDKVNEKYDAAGWIRLCDDYPSIALNLWMQSIDALADETLSISADYINPILQVAKNNPGLMGSYILSWGRIFAVYPEQEMDLRQLFLNNIDYSIPKFGNLKFAPFKMSMPEEIGFLPMIAESLCSSTYYSKNHRFKLYSFEKEMGEGGIALFGLSSDVLYSIMNKAGNCALYKAAAFTCIVFRDVFVADNSRFDIFDHGLDHVALELSTKSLPVWFITGLRIALNSMDPTDLRTSKFVGQLLVNFSVDYSCRFEFQELLGSWRERSSAPVQSKNSLISWLAN